MASQSGAGKQGDLYNDWETDFLADSVRQGHDHSGTLDPRDGLARGALLAGIGLMLLTKVVEGAVPFYIHPRYTPLIAATAVFLILLAIGHLIPVWQSLDDRMRRIVRSLGLGLTPLLIAAFFIHSPLVWAFILILLALPLVHLLVSQGLASSFGWNGFWLMLPIVFGLLIASRPLGTAALEGKDILNQAQQTTATASRWTIRDPNDTATWTLVEWATALWQQPEQGKLAGKPVDLVGFIYRPRDSSDSVHVARFVVTCCTADSSGVSLPVRSDKVASLEADTWVHVVGTLAWADTGKGHDPYIDATDVTVVPRPATPYLYP